MKRLSFLFILVGFLPQIAAANAGVVINEIAWMGTSASAANEWLELYNDGTGAVNLDGWTFRIENVKNIALSGSIAAGGFYLIERTDDDSVPNVPANLISSFGNGISNSGAILSLINATGNVINSVDASSGWVVIGGNNITKETAQRISIGWITATSTPGAASVGTQSGADSSTNLGTEFPSGGGTVVETGGGNSTWPEYVPPEKAPKIKMEIVTESRAIAGAAHRFEARVFGTNNVPITNARVIWNFGDVVLGEGRYVAHTFSHPSTYFVSANAVSGEYSASARLTINVEGNTLYISEVNPGATTTAWIEIANPGMNIADLSGWFLESAGKNFIFPDNSILAPRSFVVFTSENTGLDIPTSGEVRLFYPNGKPTNVFTYSGELGGGSSFQRVGERIMAAKATPGAASAIAPPENNARAVSVPARPAPAETVSVPKNNNTTEQTANVRDSVTHNGGGWWLWLAASGALGIFGAAAFLLTKHQTQKEAPAISKEAEEFEIEELTH